MAVLISVTSEEYNASMQAEEELLISTQEDADSAEKADKSQK